MMTLFVGMALALIGILVLLWPQRDEKDHYFANSGKNDEHTKVRSGGVVMLGPFPIVIGSDPKIALVMMVMALATMILWALTAKGV